MIMQINTNKRYGMQGMSHRVPLTPGPKSRRGPNRTTSVDLPPYSRPDRRPVRARSSRKTTGQNAQRKPLNVLQWNAEGVRPKKVPLAEKLYQEQIDIACIQETHLRPSHEFKVSGYESIRLDRVDGHKGGVLILIRDSLPNRGLTVHTNNQAEVTGADIFQTLRVFNIYCPPAKDLALDAIEIKDANCLVVGDFNNHSDRWGYASTDKRGAEVEDWEIDANLHLLNRADDTATCYSKAWESTQRYMEKNL